MDLHALRELQNERLRRQVSTVYAKVPFYRRLLDQHGVRPEDIRGVADLSRLPFTYKSALRDEYPFGLFAVPVREAVRLHCSSGTTGKPIVVGYTPHDIGVFSEVVARSLEAAGCRPGMKLQNAYGYGLFTGGLGLHYGAERLGMTVIPISGGNTDKQLMLLQDFGAEAICCTPSYALTLGEEVRKRGMALSSLRYAILGAEPWTEAIRSEVETLLGVSATNIYGLSEIIGPGVSQEDLEEKGTGSYVWEDHFFPEVVDKETGMPQPYGEPGVLVFTTLTKEAMPLLRYWTGDITSLHYGGRRPFVKMAPIMGRADDMLIIRGVNLFPTQIEACLEGFGGHYQVVVAREGTLDTVMVRVEGDPGLQPAMEYRLKSATGLTIRVQVEAPGAIPRSEGGKLSRIMDLRKKT